VALKSFKAYDIPGCLPDELNEDLAERIGPAYAQVIGRGTVVVGYDIRQASPRWRPRYRRISSVPHKPMSKLAVTRN
jgi:phosphomannomutase